jgi:hypothetical protein
VRQLLAIGFTLAVGAAAFPGCKEIEQESATGYQPSKLESVEGADVKRVTFTTEGAKRTGLRTAPVRRAGADKVVPYAALIYDAEGKTYVYTSAKPLSFLRDEVKVDRIDGARAILSEGPPAGTAVVTVGTFEVYGTELEIPSG